MTMAAVRSKGNKLTELRFLSLLREHHVTGWRRHLPLFGNPDFTFRSLRLAIFIDGCFWHGCPEHVRVPATNREYWLKKIQGNADRDSRVTCELTRRGWRVLRVWEHELKEKDKLVTKLLLAIQDSSDAHPSF